MSIKKEIQDRTFLLSRMYFMHVSPGCSIVLTVFSRYIVTDDDVRNIKTCLINFKKIFNLLKSLDLLSAFST